MIMEALISSIYLAKQIEKAVKIGFKKIDFHDNGFNFVSTGNKKVAVCTEWRISSQTTNHFVDGIYWDKRYRLMEFLQKIPEQPILFRINDRNYQDIKLELKQFTVVF